MSRNWPTGWSYSNIGSTWAPGGVQHDSRKTFLGHLLPPLKEGWRCHISEDYNDACDHHTRYWIIRQHDKTVMQLRCDGDVPAMITQVLLVAG